GSVAPLRRRRLPYDAEERRLLFFPPRHIDRTRRRDRPHPRRQISRAPARTGAGRRPARLFPVGFDPALGFRARELSLGLSRQRKALARRRPAHSQSPDAAFARELL